MSLRSAGYDFLAFYTGGTFVRTGRAAELYDLPAVRAFQQDVARQHGLEMRAGAVGPFWNPPFYAWVFAPLSRLPYPQAFTVWTVINLACFAGAVRILCFIVAPRGDGSLLAAPPADWRSWALVPLLTVTSVPFLTSIGHGQNTCASLLILCGAVALWRGRRFFAAGAVAGLLFYKPQLVAVVAGVLVFCCGWRALAGLATTGAALLLVTALTLPGALESFLAHMSGNLAFMQVERPYLWDRHVTLKSFWRLLVQGYAAGGMSPLATTLYLGSAAIVATCVAAFVLNVRRRPEEISRDRIISMTILATPLLMPFYFDYDLLLLAVPAALAARDVVVSGRADGRVTWAWVALYAWLIVNPHVAALTRVNGTVVLLAGVAGATMWNGIRRGTTENAAVTAVTATTTPRGSDGCAPARRAAAAA